MKKRIHAFVKGIVQGVFFRYTTRQVANRLKLTGWVKNTRDGMVEVIAEGDELTLLELIEFLKKGPEHATVKNLDVKWQEFKDEFKKFSIKGW